MEKINKKLIYSDRAFSFFNNVWAVMQFVAVIFLASAPTRCTLGCGVLINNKEPQFGHRIEADVDVFSL